MAKTVTNRAVPAAPATCWIVPISADPCEYSRFGSAPSATVNSGVNVNANEALIAMWPTMTSHHGVVGVRNAKNTNEASTTNDAGTTSARGPTRS